MSRKIVFINQATGYLTIDVINAFASSGDFSRVELIAGSIRVQDIPLHASVKQTKIIKYNRGSPPLKLLSWLIATIQIAFLLKFKYRKFEVFYVTVPPFAYLLSRTFKHKFSILVYDVYPDVLQIYGRKQGGIIYDTWAKWNKVILGRAHRIYTLGEGMSVLLEQYVDPDRIIIIPNWTGLTEARIIPKDENHFLIRKEIRDKFIVMYSGNIGVTHNVEGLLDIASELLINPEILFLIIGRGERFKYILNQITERGLSNCMCLPFQPDELLLYTLSASDLGVVLLDEKVANVSIPSKLFNLQACGSPILGIGDESSELARHLEQYQNGSCFSPGRKQDIVSFILEVYNDQNKLMKLKQNSIHAAKDFSIENASRYFKTYMKEQ